jgi:hypothetical protein
MEEIIDQYVIIGFDKMIEQEDVVETDESAVEEESLYEQQPENQEEVSQQEEETPLSMVEEESSGIWGELEKEGEPSQEPTNSVDAESEYVIEEVSTAQPDPDSSAYLQGYLTILDGSRKGDRVPLIPTDIMLGSSPNTDVMLTDQGIAESHARIYFKDRKYCLENLDVLGRSYVNGIQSKVVELNHNDVIRLGNLNLRVDFTPVS